MNKLYHHVVIDPNKKLNLRNMTNTKNLSTIKSSNSKSISIHFSTTHQIFLSPQFPEPCHLLGASLVASASVSHRAGVRQLGPRAMNDCSFQPRQDAAMFSWILFQFMIPNIFRNKKDEILRKKKLQEEEAMIWDILWTSMNQENRWGEEKTIVYDWGWKPLTLTSERVNRFNMRSYYQLVNHTIQRQSWHQGSILQKVFLCCCLDYVPEAKSLASKMRDHFE